MNSNPWNVGSINEFSYFNCPECTFHTKEDKNFQDHATRNHPLSAILFSKGTKVITFSGRSDLNQLKQMASEQKCNEFVSKYNLPEKLQVSISKVDESKRILNNEQQLQKVLKETKQMSHILKKGFSLPKETGKHLGSSLKEPKKNEKTISLEYQNFENAKSISNIEMKTKNPTNTVQYLVSEKKN